jgi:hypothetical protein
VTKRPALANRELPVSRPRYGLEGSPLAAPAGFALGELTAREKSMMYLTGVVQKRQGVSWISCTSSCMTLKGKEHHRQALAIARLVVDYENVMLAGVRPKRSPTTVLFPKLGTCAKVNTAYHGLRKNAGRLFE